MRGVDRAALRQAARPGAGVGVRAQRRRRLAGRTGHLAHRRPAHAYADSAVCVPAHVLASALYERFSSRGEADYADKLLSAMRKQFGGHAEQRPPV